MSAARPLVRAFRANTSASRWRRPALPLLQRRCISADEKPLPTKDTPGKGPNQDQLPHVSEEAAALGKITGEGGPELEHGTPIQEMLARDKEGAKNAPQVLKPASQPTPPKGTRSYTTSAVRRTELVELTAPDLTTSPTHKFALPTLPLPPQSHLKHRQAPIVDRATRWLMRHGELARAQTNMARILNHLRTSPPPRINPARPLVADAPPASQLPLHPVQYLTCAIDSIAPLIRIKTVRGMSGGGKTLPVPEPLELWQRRRRAMAWILEAAEKKRSRGSGKGMFAAKVAEELIAVVEGRSSVWERRQTLHKLGTTARANVVKYLARKR